MNSQKIDGKKIANDICQSLADVSVPFFKSKNINPCLAVLLVGSDPASEVYVSHKIKRAKQVGIDSLLCKLDDNIDINILLTKIAELNNDQNVHGILLQLPLPKNLRKYQKQCIELISPKKDVDGLTNYNIGLLASGDMSGLIPCTALGSMVLLKSVVSDLSGKNVLIIGRSQLVGRPLFSLLLALDATVTIAHSKTVNLDELIAKCDIVCVAIGRAEMIKKASINNNIIIDVGINRVIKDGKSKLVGDVEKAAYEKSLFYTPVPGGVGPMTVALLMYNCLKAICIAQNISFEDAKLRI